MLENNLKAIIKPQYIEQIPKAVKVINKKLLKVIFNFYNLQKINWDIFREQYVKI